MKRPIAPKTRMKLGPRQMAIMDFLWSYGPATPIQIHRALIREGKVAYTTIFTEIGRLVDKKLIKKHDGEHLTVTYEAVSNREDYTSAFVSNVLTDLLKNYGNATIHGFVDIMFNTNSFSELTQEVERQKNIRKKK